MRKPFSIGMFLLLVTFLCIVSVNAAPVINPANGHSYEAFGGSEMSWEAANSAANAAGGHLATITSAEENQFVWIVVSDSRLWRTDYWDGIFDVGPWIGGYEVSEGNWAWVTGESWSYTNWFPGEPNNGYGDESKVCLISDDYVNIAPTWNDQGYPGYGSETTKGYVVEWDTSTNQPPVANAGPDQTGTVNTLVTLDGTGSSDPDNNLPLTYAWIMSAPSGSTATLSSTTAAKPTFTPDKNGDYVITLTVKDSLGLPSTVADRVTITVTNQPLEIKNLNATMVSNNELGLGVELKYPDTLPKNTKKSVTFTATINGKTIPPQTFDVTKLKQSDMYDKTGSLKPSTPLLINLKKLNVPRFTDNVLFTLTGISTYEGGPQSEPATKEVNIPLPVVVLHGYIDILRKEETGLQGDLLVKGYPYGQTTAPSDNPNLNIGIGVRPKLYAAAYKPLSDALIKEGYVKMKNVAPGNMYVTLWDPEDPNIGYSSVSYGTPQNIYRDLDNIYKEVKSRSYADKMNIIGHSTGGLAARYYASQTNGQKVNKVITVGTPHDGLARFYQQPFNDTFLRLMTGTRYITYTSRQDFINSELVVPGTKKTENALQWFVPRWEDAIDQSIYQIKPGDPDPYFVNTFNYPFDPETKFYLIYGNYAASPTPYSIKILNRVNKKGTTVWYDTVDINYGPGDGYVYLNSASDSIDTTGQAGASITRQLVPSLTRDHGFILLDPTVQNYIVNDLK